MRIALWTTLMVLLVSTPLHATPLNSADENAAAQAQMKAVEDARDRVWHPDRELIERVISDYNIRDESDETLTASERFAIWLDDVLRNSAIADRLSGIGDKLPSLSGFWPAMVSIGKWLMIAVTAVALGLLLKSLFDHLQTARRSKALGKPGDLFATGDERGNLPVMGLDRIRALPAQQQPAALLVAAIDALRGDVLPDNPWTATNAEISATVADRRSRLTDAINLLVVNAERTLYGAEDPTRDDVARSFQAVMRVTASTPGDATTASAS